MKVRRGRIKSTRDFLFENLGIVAQVMAGGVVLNIQSNVGTDLIEWLLWHPDFREISIGVVPPIYEVQFTNDSHSGEITFKFIEQPGESSLYDNSLNYLYTMGGEWTR